MSDFELQDLLTELLKAGESEVVEFKKAARGFDKDATGEYVTALSNEANLRGKDRAWLVFGIKDDRTVFGTTHLFAQSTQQELQHYIGSETDPSLTVRDIYDVERDGKRVVLLEIPAAPRGIPIAWKGDYRARHGQSLVSLSLAKLDEIRNQTIAQDWTAAIVPSASLKDLDPAAVARARLHFAERYPRLADEIASWDDGVFLNKARITLDGAITRAAIILLGKRESAHFISPHMAELTWDLKGDEEAYEHFSTPFLLTASDLASRIRNVKLRVMSTGELAYREIEKYQERSILEALYNCIAHQDYRKNSRIIVTERPDRLEFISVGNFFSGTPEEYMLRDRIPREYRNPFLVAAMTELNLIDHMGNGIHRMVTDQRKRFLPMPDYDITTDPGEVHLTMHGAVIDEAYSQLLMARTDLPLEDVLALDRVQKRLPINGAASDRLHRAKLVEGRRPNLRVAAKIAAATGTEIQYSKSRAFDDEHYNALIIRYLEDFGKADRKTIDSLLVDKLSVDLTDEQKRNKVDHLLRKLRLAGRIENDGARPYPLWSIRP